ncbi:hypothetical protein SFRURICE_016024 [Spodoptera frugiperda]|nr:hypothetical protein SFRURICE_016024 [Spodoptera frugiperda]
MSDKKKNSTHSGQKDQDLDKIMLYVFKVVVHSVGTPEKKRSGALRTNLARDDEKRAKSVSSDVRAPFSR